MPDKSMIRYFQLFKPQKGDFSMTCYDRPGERMTRVHVVGDKFEEDIVVGALRRAGILVLSKKNEEVAYDGLFVLQKGWADILVPAAMAPRAKEIIKEITRVYLGSSEHEEGNE